MKRAESARKLAAGWLMCRNRHKRNGHDRNALKQLASATHSALIGAVPSGNLSRRSCSVPISSFRKEEKDRGEGIGGWRKAHAPRRHAGPLVPPMSTGASGIEPYARALIMVNRCHRPRIQRSDKTEGLATGNRHCDTADIAQHATASAHAA